MSTVPVGRTLLLRNAVWPNPRFNALKGTDTVAE